MDAILIENRKVQRRFMRTFMALISRLGRIFAEALIFVWVVGMFIASFDFYALSFFKSNISSFPSPKIKNNNNIQRHLET
jgi:beta-lactamase regulating signal transducer with metallopeptidase domain